MRKQITYTEPIPQFDDNQNRLPDLIQTFVVIANNDDEYATDMAAFNDLARGITILGVEDLPEDPQMLSVPAPPASGTYTLQSIDGVLQWV